MSEFRTAARIAPLVAAMIVAGCATAPSRHGGAPYSASALKLCPGVMISNAPAATGTREILSYTPFAVVRGVRLARAPVEACVSSAYGPRASGAGSFHEGLDLYTGDPSTVYAGAGGRIKQAGTQRGYGLTIEIDHGAGVTTRYAHLSSLAPQMRAGAAVSGGQPIGRTGRSGNATAVHLHYEILIDGRPKDPLKVSG